MRETGWLRRHPYGRTKRWDFIYGALGGALIGLTDEGRGWHLPPPWLLIPRTALIVGLSALGLGVLIRRYPEHFTRSR
jgi:hypothetical protein